MIILALAGLGFWVFVGAEFGFDGFIVVLAAILAGIWGLAVLDYLHGRAHRYDGIETQGRTRLGTKEAAASRNRPAAMTTRR